MPKFSVLEKSDLEEINGESSFQILLRSIRERCSEILNRSPKEFICKTIETIQSQVINVIGDPDIDYIYQRRILQELETLFTPYKKDCPDVEYADDPPASLGFLAEDTGIVKEWQEKMGKIRTSNQRELPRKKRFPRIRKVS
ncbi:hypothetical protein K9L27_01365 [Candidatus Gracilibacteria bacterium]|nr:hypothetical protein [Candidatus Gracilibacteria bacterium]